MSFNNIPPNGFPALPDIEDLEAVVKDVTALKTSVLGLTEDVTDLNEQKANQITIAPFFNSETAYEIGDLVYYNGLSYRCTNAHEGEWDADDFVGTTIANELDTLKSGLTDRAKVCLITVPSNKTDVNGFLGYILFTIITEQARGSYIVYGAWTNHDYFTGIVYKVANDTAIGIINYGASAQNMALYSACYKTDVYSDYKTVQYIS